MTFVDFLQAKKLVGKEESSLNFVSVLCNCLWTIDGHQDTMTARFCPVPSTFESFCGYNLPEKSKHAKRKLNNLCSQYFMQFHLSCLTYYREIIGRVSHGQNTSVKFSHLLVAYCSMQNI